MEYLRGVLGGHGGRLRKPSYFRTVGCEWGLYKNNCKWVTKEIQSRNTRKSKNNSTGKNGVTLSKRDGIIKDYIATGYPLSGKHKSKHFSVNKYGEEEAFRLACEYREEQIRILNEQGAGYSDNHGL